MSTPRRRRAGWPFAAAAPLAALVILAGGCRRKLAPSLQVAPPVASASSAPKIAVSSPDQPWVDARDADPLELARLCDAVGAPELGRVIGDATTSPDERATAMRALAFAEDPTPALDALCAVVSRSPIDASTIALQTLAQLAPQRRAIEEVEGGAWGRCVASLQALLAKSTDPTRRALAIRAFSAIAERGAADPATIPER